jgi:phosphoglycerol transferase MdoB-like AlkP superfamily enzyme
MNKPWFFVWLLSAPVLAGVLITVLLNMPSAQASLKVWMIVASVLSMLVTIPFAIKVGAAIEGPGPRAT